MQIDNVWCPPGLFAPARTFSLVRDEHGVYLIYTGRAMGPAQSRAGAAGAIAGAILDKVADKRAVEISANEARLRQLGAAAMKDTKHSLFFPTQAIRAIAIKGGEPPAGWPVVILKADKKVKLHFHGCDRTTIQRFFHQLPVES